MSSDCWSLPSVSSIERSARQPGPSGTALILGPFRLINHGCSPNVQVVPGLRSHVDHELMSSIRLCPSTVRTPVSCALWSKFARENSSSRDTPETTLIFREGVVVRNAREWIPPESSTRNRVDLLPSRLTRRQLTRRRGPDGLRRLAGRKPSQLHSRR